MFLTNKGMAGLFMSVLTGGLLLLFPVINSYAATVVYTDRPSFDLATGPAELENFNSYLTEVSFYATPLDVGDFTLSLVGTPSTGWNHIDLPPTDFSEFNVDGSTIVNVLTTNGDSFFITFDSPITAFGVDLASLNDELHRTDIVVNGAILTPAVTHQSAVRFFGFTSDTPFTVVEFKGLDNDGYGIDNLSYSSVPEPSSALLMLGVLLGLANRRHLIAVGFGPGL